MASSNDSVGGNSTTKNNSTSNNHKRNGSSSKGWFEGTMEVISGMEVISHLAPRPSTPVPNNPNLKKRNNNARGSMSAPSSPARSASGQSSPSMFQQMIHRLPSQDSMDRSIHNESSHGKSSTQIIRELKQHNAALSAKTATMEADFMNQLNIQNRKAEEKQRRLEETLKHRENILGNLESRCNTAEQSLKEREDQLTKLREDSAFQRHTISDLKSQLHQLEQQQENSSDYNTHQRDSSTATDPPHQWQTEKQEMEQEMEDLRAQVQDSQVLQQEINRLNHKVEEMKVFQVPNNNNDDDDDDSQMGSSQRSSYTNRSFMKQGLPQTREILKKTKHRLSVTEAALDILKQERARMMHEHQMEVDEMQQHIEGLEKTHHEREDALQKTIQLMEQRSDSNKSNDNNKSMMDPTMNSSIDGEESPSVSDAVEGINLKTQVEEANQTIADLREQVRQYSHQASELSSKLEKAQADAENQEQYRADEAEDLRVLHDAQEEEIERLRKELDYVNRELELRDQELEEQKLALENHERKAAAGESAAAEKAEEEKKAEDEEDTADRPERHRTRSTEDNNNNSNNTGVPPSAASPELVPKYVSNLKQRLEDSQAALEHLENQLDTTRKEHHDRVEHLETVLHQVTEEKEEAEEQLAQLSAVLVVGHAPNTRSNNPQTSESSEDEMSELPELPTDTTKPADLAVMLRSVEQLQEGERKAVARVKELEQVEAELEELRNSRQSETQELEELVARLKESEEKLASTRDGAMEEYRAEIQKLRAQLKAKDSPHSQDNTEEQLRSLSDAETEKTALMEKHEARVKRLEDENKDIQEEYNIVKREKEEMIESHMKTLQQLEESKASLEEDYEARIKARDIEIAQLKQRYEQADEDKAELQQQLEEVREAKQALTSNHEETLQQLKDEMQKVEEDYSEQLEAKQAEIADLTANRSSAGEPTSDLDSEQIAMLKQEVSQLQNQLVEEQAQQQERQPSSEGAFQSGGAMESDLRQQLKATKRNEQELMAAIDNLRRQKEEEGANFKEKLEDRDTTISVLVKSSRSLEQKIADLEDELHNLRSSNTGQFHARGTYNDYDEEEDDEIDDLRDALADYKEVESRLVHELSLTKKQLNFAESEIARLQEVVDDEVSCGDSHHYRRQIQERDDAVSALVQQSMSQESENHKLQKQIRSMTSELEALRSQRHGSTGHLRQELRRLQQESEIFAGQIIEQDEELEALRVEIHSRDERIASLNRQLSTARGPHYKPGMVTPDGDTEQVVSLRATIDELEEANETYRDELRDLRVRARDCDRLQDEVARLRLDLEEYERTAGQTSEAEQELRAALAAKNEAEQKLEELQAARDDENHANELLEKERKERNAVVSQRDKVIEDLRRNIDGSSTQIEALETEIDSLNDQLKEKAEELESASEQVLKLEGQLSDKSRSMVNPDGEDEDGNGNGNNESAALFEEVEDLQQQVKELEEENQKLAEFKEKMSEVEAIQEQSRKVSETYERKLSLLALDKDATIDSLRKSLMDIKGQAGEDFEAMSRDMKKMDRENKKLREEMELILEEKNTQIFALERTLDAQEQLVGNMKAEMDHLQGSMESNVYSRREEIEDMQQEVLDLTAKAASYEREITSLKMQLEESKLLHMSEAARLAERLEYEASGQQRTERAPPVESFPINEVRERLEKLRWRNNSIQEENFKLKSRLEKAEKEIQTSRNDKYRTATLEAKVGALTKQLERLESENKTAERRASRAAAAQKSSDAPKETKPSKGLGNVLPMAKMTPPQSPQRGANRPSSRSGTPLRSLLSKSRSGTPQRQKQEGDQDVAYKPLSRQSTPQRKRTPLKSRAGSEQTAPDTPGGHSTSSKRSFFGFRRKSDNSDDASLVSQRSQRSQPNKTKKKFLVPPSPSAPSSERNMNTPRSSKSLQSTK